MKKVIAIVAIVLIAVLGLTSYNTNEVKTNKNDNSPLLAALKTTKGVPVIGSGNGGQGGGDAGNKKLD